MKPAHHRQPSTIEDHAAFLESISQPCDRFDEIDLAVAECPPQCRSESETKRVLDILDEIEGERRSA